MSELKSKVISAVSEMEEKNLEAVWYFITKLNAASWEAVPSVKPDAWDLELLDSIAADPECTDFLSAEDAKAMLGL